MNSILNLGGPFIEFLILVLALVIMIDLVINFMIAKDSVERDLFPLLYESKHKRK